MTVSNGMRPVHPSEVLQENLDALGTNAPVWTRRIDVLVNRINKILNSQRSFTGDTALCLGIPFG